MSVSIAKDKDSEISQDSSEYLLQSTKRPKAKPTIFHLPKKDNNLKKVSETEPLDSG